MNPATRDRQPEISGKKLSLKRYLDADFNRFIKDFDDLRQKIIDLNAKAQGNKTSLDFTTINSLSKKCEKHFELLNEQLRNANGKMKKKVGVNSKLSQANWALAERNKQLSPLAGTEEQELKDMYLRLKKEYDKQGKLYDTQKQLIHNQAKKEQEALHIEHQKEIHSLNVHSQELQKNLKEKIESSKICKANLEGELAQEKSNIQLFRTACAIMFVVSCILFYSSIK